MIIIESFMDVILKNQHSQQVRKSVDLFQKGDDFTFCLIIYSIQYIFK